jgi:hypothetical protein
MSVQKRLVDLITEARSSTLDAMNHDDADFALLRGPVAGDEAAMHTLCAAYGQRLYAYALRLTGDSLLWLIRKPSPPSPVWRMATSG